MKQSVLQLSNEEARRYFLRASRYCTIPLPGYFDFQPLLNALDATIGHQKLSEIEKTMKHPGDEENVNYTLIHNKDGKYAWRPFDLIHPILYVKLVNDICEPTNWQLIKKRLPRTRCSYISV